MTSKRTLERRIEDLEDAQTDGGEEILGVAIGYGSDLPPGWITEAEYEAHYKDRIEITDFDFTINGDVSDLEA